MFIFFAKVLFPFFIILYKKKANSITAFSCILNNQFKLFTIAMKSSFKAALPIRPPSTSGLEKISFAFSGFTLPP
jgi:hypothetical protein